MEPLPEEGACLTTTRGQKRGVGVISFPFFLTLGRVSYPACLLLAVPIFLRALNRAGEVVF